MSELMEILGLSRSDAERLVTNNSDYDAEDNGDDYYLSCCLLRGC